MDLLVIILFALVFLVVIVIWRKVGFGTRRQLPCPSCGSDDIVVISKEPLGMTHSTYGWENWHTTSQLRYQVKYRCNRCRAEWTSEVTESG